MEDQNKNMAPVEQYEEEIDLMELLRKLLAKWKYLLKFTVCAGVFGFIIALSIVKNYTASATLAPEVVSRTGGALSSLATMAGININSTNTADAVYPEIYPNVVGSTAFVVELFSTPVKFKLKDETVETDYYTYLKEYNKSPWWSYVLSAPIKALSWFIGLFREKQEKIEGYANMDATALTYEQAGMVDAIKKLVSVSVDNKTSIISLSVSAQHPEVAYQMVEVVIEKLQSYVTGYRTEKSRKDLAYYEELCSEAEADYFESQQRYASYVDANQGVVLQRVLTERERLQNDVDLKFNLYNTCAQNVQMAKAKLQQETPVFAVITPATTPLKSSNSRMTPLVAITFLGFCCAAAWVLFIKDFLAKFKNTDNEKE